MIEPYLVQLREKGIRYWVTALVVFLLTIVGAPYIYSYLRIIDVRSQYFNKLLEFSPRYADLKFVKLLLIEDSDYWLGEAGGRRPINRRYLAKIVDKLGSMKVKVIALDFDMRLPNPASGNIPEEFRQETQFLIDAITKAAEQGIKVVLSTPIWHDHGEYIVDFDAYRAFGLCARSIDNVAIAPSKAVQNNVTCGYISLPGDPLVVPLQIRLVDGSKLDSFALAVSRAINPNYVNTYLGRIGTSTRYGAFIAHDKFLGAHSIFHVSDILKPGSQNDDLQANAVIVGGDWRSFAFERGPLIDLHWTPTGWTIGAELHANFVEDILDGRTYGISPGWFLRGTEVILSLFAAVAFALIGSFWWKLAGVLSLSLMVLLIQWLVLNLFGVFFDAFVPIVGLGLHALYERLVGEVEPAPSKAGKHFEPPIVSC
jgi:CHASE2 domain-containing sensor protein